MDLDQITPPGNHGQVQSQRYGLDTLTAVTTLHLRGIAQDLVRYLPSTPSLMKLVCWAAEGRSVRFRLAPTRSPSP